MSLNPGQIVQGRYVIQARLGQGGMGAVYRAHDQTLNRAVAIKERVPDPNASPQALAQARVQFQREAQVLANLNHPNLPRVTDYFTFNGNEYLVMDFIEGQNLGDLVQQLGALPEVSVRAWADQLLDALAYIHARNIIHRDIKPQNLILTPDGRVVLVDFGLVKLLDPNDARTMAILRGMGTPEYAPLEQYAGGSGHTDARSDLYSLGATLYHLLTGKLPIEVHQRILNPAAQPAPRTLNSSISQQMEWLVLKAMEVYPQQRFQSATEMRQALTRPANALPPQPQEQPIFVYTTPIATPSAGRNVNVWMLIATLLVVGILGAMLAIAFGLPTALQQPTVPAPTTTFVARGAMTAEPPPPTITTIEPTRPSVPEVPLPTPTPKPTLTTAPSRTATPSPMQTSSLPVGMVFIPAGEFWMGKAETDNLAAPDESPGALIYVSAFFIDKYEVSNGEYQKCVQAGKCDKPTGVFSSQSPHLAYGNPQFNDFPVVFVSQSMASAYCVWQGKRLPLEAEWEKAARGNLDQRIYPWGNVWDGYRVNAAKNEPGPERITAYNESVGKNNGCSVFGVCNMAGNVAEWIGDFYSSNWYKDRLVRNLVRDPAYWSTSPSAQFNVRGGSFKSLQPDVRVSKRSARRGSDTVSDVGFRCVQDAH